MVIGVVNTHRSLSLAQTPYVFYTLLATDFTH